MLFTCAGDALNQPLYVIDIAGAGGKEPRATIAGKWPVDDAGGRNQTCSKAARRPDAISFSGFYNGDRGGAIAIFCRKGAGQNRQSLNGVLVDQRKGNAII